MELRPDPQVRGGGAAGPGLTPPPSPATCGPGGQFSCPGATEARRAGPSLAGRWSEPKAGGPHDGLFSQELPRRGVRPRRKNKDLSTAGAGGSPGPEGKDVSKAGGMESRPLWASVQTGELVGKVAGRPAGIRKGP